MSAIAEKNEKLVFTQSRGMLKSIVYVKAEDGQTRFARLVRLLMLLFAKPARIMYVSSNLQGGLA